MTVLAGAKIKIFSFAIRSPFKILQQHTSLTMSFAPVTWKRIASLLGCIVFPTGCIKNTRNEKKKHIFETPLTTSLCDTGHTLPRDKTGETFSGRRKSAKPKKRTRIYLLKAIVQKKKYLAP